MSDDNGCRYVLFGFGSHFANSTGYPIAVSTTAVSIFRNFRLRFVVSINAFNIASHLATLTNHICTVRVRSNTMLCVEPPNVPKEAHSEEETVYVVFLRICGIKTNTTQLSWWYEATNGNPNILPRIPKSILIANNQNIPNQCLPNRLFSLSLSLLAMQKMQTIL
jgi:hypothetical protein